MVPLLVKVPVQRITVPLATVRVAPVFTVKSVNCRLAWVVHIVLEAMTPASAEPSP
jgi:hypothetical protein